MGQITTNSERYRQTGRLYPPELHKDDDDADQKNNKRTTKENHSGIR